MLNMDNSVTTRKSTKGKRSKPKADALECKRREFLRAKLKEKVEHERRAQQAVERLLEDAVSEDFLIHCAYLITADNYRDTVEERFIAKLCGYPICANKLDNVPRQKYKIFTKTNKVYDITERKCFCSNFCYKASKWFEVQIPKTPLWLREDERPSDVKLMKKQEGGSSGLEVALLDQPVKEADIENPVLPEPPDASTAAESNSGDEGHQEVFVTSALSKCHLRVHWGELPQDSGDIKRAQAEKERQQLCSQSHFQNKSIPSATQGCSTQVPSSGRGGTGTVEKHTHADPEAEEMFLGQAVARTDDRCLAKPFSQEISRLIQTDETSIDVIQPSMEKRQDQLQSLEVRKAEISLIKLSLLERLKLTLLEWKSKDTMKFLYGSDYTMGDFITWQQDEEEEGDEDDIKETSDSSLQNGTENQDLPLETKGSKDPVLPLVDCHSQRAIQKRIVLERLSKSLKTIMGPLHLTESEVASDLNSLVRTLRLTHTNIIHKSPEWTVIAVVFLCVLTEVSPLLRERLIHPSTMKFISSLMKELHLTDQDLHSLIQLYCPKTELYK